MVSSIKAWSGAQLIMLTHCGCPRFPSVAKEWAAALLRECDVEKHGVDLMGRDSLLLGRLLITLASQQQATACCACCPTMHRWLSCLLQHSDMWPRVDSCASADSLLLTARPAADMTPAKFLHEKAVAGFVKSEAAVPSQLASLQGTFVEAAAPAPVSMQLAAAVLELICSAPVGAHAQPYVRRAAIVTASQVLLQASGAVCCSITEFQSSACS